LLESPVLLIVEGPETEEACYRRKAGENVVVNHEHQAAGNERQDALAERG